MKKDIKLEDVENALNKLMENKEPFITEVFPGLYKIQVDSNIIYTGKKGVEEMNKAIKEAAIKF